MPDCGFKEQKKFMPGGSWDGGTNPHTGLRHVWPAPRSHAVAWTSQGATAYVFGGFTDGELRAVQCSLDRFRTAEARSELL
jgi:hypothetical protein